MDMERYRELLALEDQLMSWPQVLGRLLSGDRQVWHQQRLLRRELRTQHASRRHRADQIFAQIERELGPDAERQARIDARIAWEVYTNGGSVNRPVPWDVFAEEAREQAIERQRGEQG